MAEKYKFGFFEKREIACNTNYKFIAAISYNILLYVTGFIVSYFFYKLFVTINVAIILVNTLGSSLRSRLALIPLSHILFVFPRFLFVFTGVHVCSTCVYACVLLVLTCVLIVFTGVHSCLPVLTGVLTRVLL